VASEGSKLMSPGLIKGLLVSMIVFGLETLLLAVYYLFRRDSRATAVKYLVRAGMSLAVFSIAFLVFRPDFIVGDFSLSLVFMVYAVLTGVAEMILARNAKILISGPITREEWKKLKTTKRRFLLMVTLAGSWFLVTPAIVFTIVAPEVLPVYWWPILIVSLSVVGFVCGLWYWNSNEKRFSTETKPLQQQ
jgi:hypothetical protein